MMPKAASRNTKIPANLKSILMDSRRLLSERGEMNGASVARHLVQGLQRLDEDQLDGYFTYLARDLSPDPAKVLHLAQAYAEHPDAQVQIELMRAVEPPRQELLRRMNRTPGGTDAILHLRRALLRRLKRQPELQALEADMLHLLSSWFNPGFLRMRRVDWNAPAQLLEKIIQHEAVHEIDGWDDLRRRLQPDRRCFAFFHPQVPDEPLIFVEVALTPEIPNAIAPLIDKRSAAGDAHAFEVATFYSISNCEPGLKGVSLGNFLIKQVAEQLKREFPRLKVFCTLSPIPGLVSWLQSSPDWVSLAGGKPGQEQRLQEAWEVVKSACGADLKTLAGRMAEPDTPFGNAMMTLAAVYLKQVSPSPAGDPVARFHLDNGARLERLNLGADRSAKGLKQSCAMMVNYLYDLKKIESNNLRFRSGDVARSRAIDGLL